MARSTMPRERVQLVNYPAGHMMYVHHAAMELHPMQPYTCVHPPDPQLPVGKPCDDRAAGSGDDPDHALAQRQFVHARY